MELLFDINEDKKQKARWLSEGEPDSCLMSDLADYAINGLARCEHYCGSEAYLGEESCFCVRARFPSPIYYDLFNELREIGKELVFLQILANLSQDEIPEGILKKGENENE